MTNPTYSNIVSVFDLASASDKAEGAVWYRTAQDIAVRIADDFNIDAITAAGVIAALSPNNRWERNMEDSENVIRAWRAGGSDAAMEVKACTYGAMKAKAVRILDEYSPKEGGDLRTILNILNGRKIKAFFGCIINVDRNDNRVKRNEELGCCVDGHAYGIWVGQRLSMKDVPNIGVKLYQSIASEYHDACDYINERDDSNYTTAQIQAITWVAWRRLHGV